MKKLSEVLLIIVVVLSFVLSGCESYLPPGSAIEAVEPTESAQTEEVEEYFCEGTFRSDQAVNFKVLSGTTRYYTLSNGNILEVMCTDNGNYQKTTELVTVTTHNKMLEDCQKSAEPEEPDDPEEPAEVEEVVEEPAEAEEPVKGEEAATSEELAEVSDECYFGVLIPFAPLDDQSHGRFATDIIMPDGLDLIGCYRSWKAVNPDHRGSKETSWINLLCDMKSSNASETTLVLNEPIKYLLTGKGVFSFVLTRDHYAIQQLKKRGIWNGKDPYDVSVVGDYSQQSDTLSVYFSGSGMVRNANDEWIDLSSQSFFQVPFPKDFENGWLFDFDLQCGNSVEIWIGATEYVAPGSTELHSLFDLPVIVDP